ncbi:endoplasmic reticulum-plasma membrane tethering protein [Aureococcus anophagefferens]|uniref:subtilisin n=1 Tax=Aureococcus anophagefferens TaxID=44056 RepID=A0ABR1G0X6_AURAN
MKLALALVPTTAAALAAGRTVMEPDVTVFEAPNWVRGERVAASALIELEFWLKHDAADLAAFHDDLVERSTPGSAKYSDWLSKEEVRAMLAPSREALDAVLDYVVHDLGAADVHVDDFKSLVRFPRLRRSDLVAAAVDAAPNATGAWAKCGAKNSAYTNPYVLAERYGFEFPLTDAADGNSMAVAEFQGQYWDPKDLGAFSTACGLPSAISVSKTVGGNVPLLCEGLGQGCVESLLDIEYAGSIAGAIPLEVYYSGTYSLLAWANKLGDATPAPLVNSVSYGNDEAQQTGSALCSAYMESVNAAFMKVSNAGGKRVSNTGVSILFAAGDQGVWGREGPGLKYHPDFPAASPYVTAVGGTDFATKSVIGDETTWNDGGSGFSNEFAQPAWQADDVAAYLKSATGLPKARMYNATGRAYPDVAALAGLVNPYLVALSGGKSFAGVGGTSAASPTVAAMIAQVNNNRLKAGKKSMGWLNPFLYKTGEAAFHDVTTGKTSGGFTGGFPAAPGWDAATGFGTVDFKKLNAAALAA